jgi:hypothetical protein
MITNENSYLLLKQMVIVLKFLKLNGEVKFNDTLGFLSVDSVKKVINKTIDEITQEYYEYKGPPDRHIPYDFFVCKDCIRETMDMEGSEHSETIRSLDTNPDKLVNAVNHYPMMAEQYEMCRNNVRNNDIFVLTKESIDEIYEQTARALQFIKSWVEGYVKASTGQLIVLINLLELTERMFVYVTDTTEVEDGTNG